MSLCRLVTRFIDRRRDLFDRQLSWRGETDMGPGLRRGQKRWPIEFEARLRLRNVLLVEVFLET